MKILFSELFKYKLSIFFLLVTTYIATTFELALPLLLASALNLGIINNQGIEYIKYIAIMMLTLIICIILFSIIINFIITRISTNISTNIKNTLFSKVLSLKQYQLKNYPLSTLITRTTQDCEQIKNFLNSILSIIFKAPIIIISSITILKELNTKFFFILIISMIVIIIFLILIILKIFPLTKKIETSIDLMNNHIKDKITGYKIIKTYNNFNLEDQKFEKESNNYLNTTKKILKISSLITPFLTLIVNTITIIILTLCITLTKSNQIEAGTIIATIQYILQILLSFIMLSIIIINYPTIKISLNRINEILKEEGFSSIKNEENLQINNISFNNVTFNYNNKIIDNLNLTINKGETLGIIGLNGSGKSTLIKLLLKELDNYQGCIKINNIDIKDLTRKDITNCITYLPQTPYLLKGTILENIAFSNNSLTMPDISKIIHTCNLEKFILEKKENLNYQIQENGANLSGGQKQRISLARAIASKNSFIILDDSFSSLDYKNEKEIIEKLKTYYKDKTFVIISQRISSLLQCDKIAVINKGKIIDIGSHIELLKRNELYKEIYNTQKEVIEYDI